MEINKHENSRLVDIWLTREEQTDPAAQTKMRELSRQYSVEKWTVAVFCSGQQDLVEETGALLRYNRRRSAEQAVQREKAQKRRDCR